MVIKRYNKCNSVNKIISVKDGGDTMEAKKDTKNTEAKQVSKSKRDKLYKMLTTKHKTIYEKLAK